MTTSVLPLMSGRADAAEWPDITISPGIDTIITTSNSGLDPGADNDVTKHRFFTTGSGAAVTNKAEAEVYVGVYYGRAIQEATAEAAVYQRVVPTGSALYTAEITGGYDLHQFVIYYAEGTSIGTVRVVDLSNNAMVLSEFMVVRIDQVGVPTTPEKDGPFRISLKWYGTAGGVYGIGVYLKLDGRAGVLGGTWCDSWDVQGIYFSSISISSENAVYADDFDTGGCADWMMEETGGFISADLNNGNYKQPSMMLQKTTASGKTIATHFFEPLTGRAVVQVKMKASVSNPNSYFFLRDMANTNIYLAIRAGNIAYLDGTGWHNLRSYIDGQWCSIKLDINVAAMKYDIFCDGVKFTSSSVSFYYGSPRLDNMQLQAAEIDSGLGLSLWVDDIFVRTGSALFIDDFTRSKLGAWWTPQVTGGSVSIDLSTGYSYSGSMKIYKSKSTGTASAETVFGSQSTRLFVELKVMANLVYVPFSNFCLKAGDYKAVVCGFEYGYLGYYDSAGWHHVVSVEADTWYRLGLDIDIKNRKFDIFMDGKKWATGANFFEGSAIDRLYLQAGETGSSGVVLWVDDVYIIQTVAPPPPPPILWSDNFDDGSISDWIRQTGGTGVIDVRSAGGHPYGMHIKFDGVSSVARATSPQIANWDTAKDYKISLNYYAPTVPSSRMRVFVVDDGRICLTHEGDKRGGSNLFWVDSAGMSWVLGSIAIGQWNWIEIQTMGSTYTVSVDGTQIGDTCNFKTPSSMQNSLCFGSLYPTEGRKIGEAYWDNIAVQGYTK